MVQFHLSQLPVNTIFRVSVDPRSLPFYRGRFVGSRNRIKCRSVYDHVIRYFDSELLVYIYPD